MPGAKGLSQAFGGPDAEAPRCPWLRQGEPAELSLALAGLTAIRGAPEQILLHREALKLLVALHYCTANVAGIL